MAHSNTNRKLIEFPKVPKTKLKAPRVRLTVWMNMTWATTLTCELANA